MSTGESLHTKRWRSSANIFPEVTQILQFSGPDFPGNDAMTRPHFKNQKHFRFARKPRVVSKCVLEAFCLFDTGKLDSFPRYIYDLWDFFQACLLVCYPHVILKFDLKLCHVGLQLFVRLSNSPHKQVVNNIQCGIRLVCFQTT